MIFVFIVQKIEIEMTKSLSINNNWYLQILSSFFTSLLNIILNYYFFILLLFQLIDVVAKYIIFLLILFVHIFVKLSDSSVLID